jgi:hypothetical protein
MLGHQISRFDQFLLDNQNSREAFGYKAESGDVYPEYFIKEVFQSFLREMKESYPSAYADYGGGKGGEFKERSSRADKEGRKKRVPPKMASVGSSSRFVYLTFRDFKPTEFLGSPIKNGTMVKFEKGLVIYKSHSGAEFDLSEGNVLSDDAHPTAPQMDAFFDSATRPVFIEAKCHEILAKHVAILDATYRGLMDLFGFDGVTVKPFYDKRKKKLVDKMIVPLANFGFGQNVKDLHFDIKQFLCHLMGIACYCKRERKQGAAFSYLFCFPKGAQDPAIWATKGEIATIFSSPAIKRFTDAFHISLYVTVSADPNFPAFCGAANDGGPFEMHSQSGRRYPDFSTWEKAGLR